MLTPTRLLGVALIFVVATVGWFILGGSVTYRTDTSGDLGWEKVGNLWGSPQVQAAPTFSAGGTPIELASSDITASFELDQRQKGLLWFSTYSVDLSARYEIRNDAAKARSVTMQWVFPSSDGVYDGFAVKVEGEDVPVEYVGGAAVATFEVPPGEGASIETGYRTQGLDEWRYAPTTEGVGVVSDFHLVMDTDFPDVDFPGDAVSPTSKKETETGWELVWEYDSLVSGRPIGLTMPTPLNPGPVSSRISFFAPISLLFYFAAVVLVSATRKIKIHPMNLAFLAAAFFAFHLLFAYLVDRVDIYVSFGIASAVSVALCIGYLKLFISDRLALAELAVSQLIFLVLFSFSFFFEGLTGLAVTIGSVVTLAYFMARTGRIDWEEAFAKSSEERRSKRLEQSAYQPPPASSDRA